MQTFYSDKHFLQNPETELDGGLLVPTFESPLRAEQVLKRLQEVELGEIVAPDSFEPEVLLSVHDADYIEFLQTAWSEWTAAGMQGEIIPMCWPFQHRPAVVPRNIDGKVGYYAQGSDTNIVAGTWEAAFSSAQSSLSAAQQILSYVQAGQMSRGRAAFALGRPPGHHAAKNMYSGYCFLNNAALAAQYWRDKGVSKVAVLDVDFHHGNGTQDIFYQRDDVLFTSIHGDPLDCFPHYWGHADEVGEGAGEGFNLNLPLPPGTGFSDWRAALATAMNKISTFGAQMLVVSLGVDTFEDDPISSFRLKTPDYLLMGADIAGLDLPTLFVMEGGYNTEALGVNMVNVLQGFEGQA